MTAAGVAVAASGSGAGEQSAAPRCVPPRAGAVTVTVRSGGMTRSALVRVPAGARSPAPLLLAFHGAGGNGPFMEGYSGLSGPATRRGMLVAYPTADPARRRWTLAGDPAGAADDVAFVAALLGALERRFCADPEHVYATGVSNGGGFAAHLACRLPGRLAAIAPVAGAYRVEACPGAGPLSVLEIHGTSDDSAPYAGRPPVVEGVREWVEGWAARDGCGDAAERRRIARRATLFDWLGCATGAAVAQIVITDGEHAWPGAMPPDPGPQATISAATQVVGFLAERRR